VITDPEPVLRRPTEDDQPRIAGLVEHWFAGRRVWPLVGRTWFRNFADTSLLLEASGNAAPLAFLLGFRSPSRPDESVLHLVAVEPNARRRGHGRRLVDTFAEEQTAAGAHELRTIAWPDDRGSIDFFRALGFAAVDDPLTQNLYGVPALADYEFAGEDRAVLVRRLSSR
jgi:ribosomal protein S18 acetylase RimI-like enzyme